MKGFLHILFFLIEFFNVFENIRQDYYIYKINIPPLFPSLFPMYFPTPFQIHDFIITDMYICMCLYVCLYIYTYLINIYQQLTELIYCCLHVHA